MFTYAALNAKPCATVSFAKLPGDNIAIVIVKVPGAFRAEPFDYLHHARDTGLGIYQGIRPTHVG